MLIYNVTIQTDADISEEWLQWMKAEHLPEMMATGLFLRYNMCRLLEQEEDDTRTFVVQYHCADWEQYREYLSQHAERMRAKSFEKFGNRFVGFRTVMELLE